MNITRKLVTKKKTNNCRYYISEAYHGVKQKLLLRFAGKYKSGISQSKKISFEPFSTYHHFNTNIKND